VLLAVSNLNLGRLQYRDITDNPDSWVERVTGLNPNTTYRVFLRAATRVGAGEPIFIDATTELSGRKCCQSAVNVRLFVCVSIMITVPPKGHPQLQTSEATTVFVDYCRSHISTYGYTGRKPMSSSPSENINFGKIHKKIITQFFLLEVEEVIHASITGSGIPTPTLFIFSNNLLSSLIYTDNWDIIFCCLVSYE